MNLQTMKESEMSESFETGYYKAVVDDLTVSKERVTEERNELRDQVAAQNEIIATLTMEKRALLSERDRLRLALAQGVEL
jgi:hypothetical protein